MAVHETFAASSADAAQSRINLALGPAVTTGSKSAGVTQTDGQPAFQGYVKIFDISVYLCVWASNARFGGAKDAEISFYGGIRPTVGGL